VSPSERYRDPIADLCIPDEQRKLDEEISQIEDPEVRARFKGKVFGNYPLHLVHTTCYGTERQMEDHVYKVYATLFAERSCRVDVELFSWQEFCYAMYAVGFDPMKQYGSLWHFQKGKGDGARVFQSHEPFETEMVPHLNARLMGDSLCVEFGWWLDNLPRQERKIWT
jgi:hypothetical protein